MGVVGYLDIKIVSGFIFGVKTQVPGLVRKQCQPALTRRPVLSPRSQAFLASLQPHVQAYPLSRGRM